MMNSGSTKYACGVEYLGTDYKGWQSQDNQDTIQDRIESALSKVANERLRIYSAGRTDSGVHAYGQVFHFSSNANRNENQWLDGINSYLPSDIHIQWIQLVDEAFDARRTALSRTYVYLINNNDLDVFNHQRALYVRQSLNTDVMTEASQLLIGKHDFSSFRASSCQSNNPVREMKNIDLKADQLIAISFTANAFLHHMIRNIIGTLIDVGSGKLSPKDFEKIMHQRDRSAASKTASAKGLHLTKINYPKDYDFPYRSFVMI